MAQIQQRSLDSQYFQRFIFISHYKATLIFQLQHQCLRTFREQINVELNIVKYGISIKIHDYQTSMFRQCKAFGHSNQTWKDTPCDVGWHRPTYIHWVCVYFRSNPFTWMLFLCFRCYLSSESITNMCRTCTLFAC